MVKENTSKKKILPSAKKVFLEKGTTGARMQDIADEAGINKAMLHYYFRNKEKLFDVIFKQSSALFFPKISGIIQSEISLFEKIEKFCTAYIDMLLQKFWKNREDLFAKFAKDISSKIAKRKITGINPAHIFLNMISMCLFPFIAKPVWMMSSGMKQEEFIRFMEERKKIVPGFIIQSLKQ